MLKRLREEGHTHVDEGANFRTLETLRAITEEAVTRSKTARRQRERRLRLIQGGLTAVEPANAPEVGQSDDAASNTQHPWEQMLPVEEWT